ncbi:Ribosomal RNA-processing protein 15 [Colletotrichum orbiculare MAFF 240422]|uniref:Ribosomal RNA-processing protein 15 n=1 Tax=Colletotrichum orbiculare (strain 104-T / ATCC 96160 / CBS 514.97 / LARS 414 / MAFF 240422) TaxID=1213857 RepID=N4VF58_COLOR|nr:Ribosomal RNA-processing protein 15 [Colletotrichum orbiculare MAFF 240422]
MAGTSSSKKRTNDGRLAPPTKKQKRQDKKQAEAGSDEEKDFDAVKLLDSDDDDILNAAVDDGAATDESMSSDEERPAPKKKVTKKTATKPKKSRDAPVGTDESDSGEGESGDDNDDEGASRKSKSKRNDPAAFSTSISKILSTKLSNAKRADPVLARSADAHEAAKAAVDSALENKARRQMRQQKREALQKGRVRDVLIADEAEAISTGEMLEGERRLRKVAQRGVVKLFNAVRAAQVKAAEAEKKTRKEGVVGVTRREEKINEMSKKGFLDLIASGGGGLKKGALEEA